MAEFRMPSLGADMDRGVLLEWRVAPGDHVAKGDIVAVIDTEKSDIEVEIFHAGTVQELLVPEGEEVEVGTVLATLLDDDSATVAAAGPAPPQPTTASAAADHPPVHSPIVRHLAEERGIDLDHIRGSGPGGAITRADLETQAPPPPRSTPAQQQLRSSPLARRRATELGVDLSTVSGSGPAGAITVTDVEAAAGELPRTEVAPPPTAPDARPPRGDRSSTVRAATGRLMARSKREIPHYYLSTTVDLHDALARLERVNRDRPITERILPAALLLHAVVAALGDQPRLNGWWIDDELRPASQVDLGVGVTLRGGGLIAPVIPAADRLDLAGIMDALRSIVGRARSGRLRGSDLGEASITVTNLGDQGVETVYGVIAPPQVAVVGMGAVLDRPWALDGMLTVRPLITITLSADHRATDGHEGARFLTSIEHRLHESETP